MKKFLFLQGVASPFFALLADRLVQRGHQVLKIQFCGGDMVYWFPRKALHFRKSLDVLPELLQQTFQREQITDVVLFGDQRPVHQSVHILAKAKNIAVHVFEEGYLRPFWLTLERGGVNAHSQLPKDPDWYRHIIDRVPIPDNSQAFLGQFKIRALHDVLYHSGDILNPVAYRHYRHHAPMHPMREYFWYMRRYPKVRHRLKSDLVRNYRFVESGQPFFLLPLQLYSDSQITCHSEFCDTYDFIRQSLESFARYADKNLHLVIKNHPLDPGILPYEAFAQKTARQLGILDRIHYYDYGNLELFLQHCEGVVTINSTVGTWALNSGKPVITLADPVYNVAGLTSQQRLAEFWNQPHAPEPELWSAFRRVLIYGTQINGGFYCNTGMQLALEAAAARLELQQSPIEELLCRNDLRKPSSLPARPAPLAPPWSPPTPDPA